MKLIKREQIQKARDAQVKDIPRLLMEAEEISKMIEAKNFEGLHKEAAAIAANQTDSRLDGDKDCQAPSVALNYFVLDKSLKGLGSHIIINPKIVSKELTSICDSKEACMSYPYKREKRVDRYLAIRVEYQIIKRVWYLGFMRTLVTERRKMGGMPAIVFQHEVQHLTDGKTIYD